MLGSVGLQNTISSARWSPLKNLNVEILVLKSWLYLL